MPPDWRRIAQLVRDDWKRSGATQSVYGAAHKLSQSQISELINGKLRRMTPDIKDFLISAFTAIPEASGDAVVDEDQIAALCEHVRTELARVRPEARAQVIEHVRNQVSMLVVGREAAAGGAPAPKERKPPERRRASGQR